MALPTKDQNHISDSGPARPNRPQLWSRIVDTTKSSLLHEDQVSIDQETGYTIHKSLTYRKGRSSGSVLFDVSIRPETQKQFFGIIAKAFPNRWGVAFHMERNKRKVIEVCFLKEEDRAEALLKGLVFEDNKVRILPTPALEHEANVIRLSLSHLPFVAEDALLEGLRASLVPYGRVLDVGISREKDYQTYIGEGYAVLDTSIPDDADEAFTELSHNIPWEQSLTNGFRATWHNMKPWCSYCHDDSGDHTARICPQRPGTQKAVCWNCNTRGHFKSECPAKRPRKSPLSVTNTDTFHNNNQGHSPSRATENMTHETDAVEASVNSPNVDQDHSSPPIVNVVPDEDAPMIDTENTEEGDTDMTDQHRPVALPNQEAKEDTVQIPLVTNTSTEAKISRKSSRSSSPPSTPSLQAVYTTSANGPVDLQKPQFGDFIIERNARKTRLLGREDNKEASISNEFPGNSQ